MSFIIIVATGGIIFFIVEKKLLKNLSMCELIVLSFVIGICTMIISHSLIF